MRRVDEIGHHLDSQRDSAEPPAEIELSIVLPCLNNESTLAGCIRAVQATFADSGLSGEVVVADYGSTDNSAAIARTLGARVVSVVDGEYGAAVRVGASASQGEWILIANADEQFDLREFPRFVMRLRAGSDLVVGCRWTNGGGLIQAGASLSWIQRLSAPLCDLLARRIFGVNTHDTQCGMCAIRRDFFEQLDLHSRGVEIDSEMVIKAAMLNGRITQAPVTLRENKSAPNRGVLSDLADAWKRLKPFVLMSPQWTLMFPSYLLMMLGVIGFFAASWDSMLAVRDLHAPLFGLSTIAVIVGFQLLQFGLYAKAQAGRRGILPLEPGLVRDSGSFSLERGIVISLTAMSVGALFVLIGLGRRGDSQLVTLLDPAVLSLTAPGFAPLSLGLQLLAGELTVGLLELADRPIVAQEPLPIVNRPPSEKQVRRRVRRERSRSPWEVLNPRRRDSRSPDAVQTPNQLSRRDETVGMDATQSFSRKVD